MKMNVIYALSAVLAAVCDNAEAVVKPLFLGDFCDYLKDVGDSSAVFGSYVGGGISDMFLGYYENMHWSHRVDVLEGENGFVLVNLGRGDIALRNFAE